MGKTIFANFNKENLNQTKEKVSSKFKKAKNWAIRNKEVLIVVAPIVIGVAGFVGKAAIKNINLRKQESVKNLYCYDRSLGHYWSLKRNLTNREWVEIDKRKASGERLADILSELKVLK